MRVRRGEGRKENVIIEKSGRIKYVDVNQLVVTASIYIYTYISYISEISRWAAAENPSGVFRSRNSRVLINKRSGIL